MYHRLSSHDEAKEAAGAAVTAAASTAPTAATATAAVLTLQPSHPPNHSHSHSANAAAPFSAAASAHSALTPSTARPAAFDGFTASAASLASSAAPSQHHPHFHSHSHSQPQSFFLPSLSRPTSSSMHSSQPQSRAQQTVWPPPAGASPLPHTAFIRSSSAPSSSSSAPASVSVSRSPSSLSLLGDSEAGSSSGGSSRRGSTPTTHSPAVLRLLSIRSAYLNETGLSPVSAEFASAPPSSSSLSLASQLPSASLPLSPASRLPRSLRFAFSSPSLESAYQSDYFSRYFKPLRRIVLACVTIWCLFVINDVYQHNQPTAEGEAEKRKRYSVTVGLRFGVAGLVAASTVASYHPTVRAAIGPRVLRWCVAGYIVLFGTCQVAFGVIEQNTHEPTYCDFIILLAAMSASLFRLPFFLSTACNMLLFVVFVLLTVSTDAYGRDSPSSDLDVPGFLEAISWLVVALLLFTVNGFLVERSMRSTFFAAQQLAAEEANSQRVLATMLPVRVIAELRVAKSAFVYEYHRSVSVLFSHIHHFDQHTATLEATAVVELLNSLFSRFDHLTTVFGVYKVETIGDVYLVSGGVPDALEPHASILALLALAMMGETSRFLASRQLQLRIGVHSGNVIAGVVGMKYPRYRLMGDTVNTASRMSTTCQANQIQISKPTFSLLSPDFLCLYHGPRLIKGKGPMDTYLLKEVLPPPGLSNPRRAAQRWAADDEKEPMYHSVPVPGQLYSNVTVPSQLTTFRADDSAAIARDRDAGKTVHRLRVDAVADEQEERREPQQQQQHWEDDQKEGRPQRLLARTSSHSPQPSENDRLSPPHSQQPPSRFPPAIRIPSPQSTSPLTSAKALSPQSLSPSQQSISPSTPVSLSPLSGEWTDLSGAPVPSPSATYTLSAERVRDNFLSHSSSHEAALLQRSSVSGFSPPQQLLTRLAHPISSLRELLHQLVASFRPAFASDPFLASEFQAHWARRTVGVSRLGFTVFVMGLLVLGVVEMAVEELNAGQPLKQTWKLWQTWLLRALAMLWGLAVLLFSLCYEAAFCKRQQPVVAFSWTVMTVLTIGVSMVRGDNTILYGVSVTILLVTTSSFFVGLQFRWVSFTTLPILLFYFIAALVVPHSSILNSFFLLAAVCLSMMSAHAAEHFARLDFVRHRTLNEEEAKTRYILDNMLPKTVMDQLVRQHRTGHISIIAHQCERAAVMFCDIVSFTALAAVIRAEDVVAILNVLFSTFDALTTLHSVYKVETIGDAYLACSGVVQSQAAPSHTSQHNHVESLVLCALDFLAASSHCRTPDDKPLQVRIGIHTGTVVAGVIGIKMPRYHLFGESVTIAEEVEQSGLAGRVVISDATHQHCQQSFVCRLLKPLTRSATHSVIPRYEVLGLAGGRRTERLSLPLDDSKLSALPKVVLDILHKVRAPNGAAEEAAAAVIAVPDGRDGAAAAASSWGRPADIRDRAVTDAPLRPSRSQMNGHLTPLLSDRDA